MMDIRLRDVRARRGWEANVWSAMDLGFHSCAITHNDDDDEDDARNLPTVSRRRSQDWDDDDGSGGGGGGGSPKNTVGKSPHKRMAQRMALLLPLFM